MCRVGVFLAGVFLAGARVAGARVTGGFLVGGFFVWTRVEEVRLRTDGCASEPWRDRERVVVAERDVT